MGRQPTFLMILLAAASLLFASRPQVSSAPSAQASSGQNGTNEPLAIVVNRANSVNNLTMAELRRVFLGDRSHWPNDRRITLVMREPGEPERKTMLHDVYQMDEGALKNHFLRGLFTGEIQVSPKVLASAVGVRKFVFNVPGAIGYMRLSDVDGSVKVIRIDELLPGDKKYKLHVEVRPPNP
jgi:ABC-type phosphate transport system substrate-binding protein